MSFFLNERNELRMDNPASSDKQGLSELGSCRIRSVFVHIII